MFVIHKNYVFSRTFGTVPLAAGLTDNFWVDNKIIICMVTILTRWTADGNISRVSSFALLVVWNKNQNLKPERK